MAVDCVPQTAGYLSVTTSSLEDYLFRGDHPILKDMSWSTYGMWVYRVELPPGAGTSVRAAFPRFMDLYFDSAYKLYKSHCQRISTEPRVPMFEGFTMPTLTTDSERNAMYKQLQCRPFAISQSRTSGASAEELVIEAFSEFCHPLKPATSNRSLAAATAFTESYLEWFAVNLESLARARQEKPKKRRDVDQYLQQDFVKITTAGEGDDVSVDGEEETEEVQLEGAKRPATVFQPIVHRPSAEEQRRLLQLGYQARKNQYTNEFLQETWLQKDVFEVAQAAPKECHGHEGVFAALSSLDQAAWSAFKNISMFACCEDTVA